MHTRSRYLWTGRKTNRAFRDMVVEVAGKTTSGSSSDGWSFWEDDDDVSLQLDKGRRVLSSTWSFSQPSFTGLACVWASVVSLLVELKFNLVAAAREYEDCVVAIVKLFFASRYLCWWCLGWFSKCVPRMIFRLELDCKSVSTIGGIGNRMELLVAGKSEPIAKARWRKRFSFLLPTEICIFWQIVGQRKTKR